jgi:hypothetical protein
LLLPARQIRHLAFGEIQHLNFFQRLADCFLPDCLRRSLHLKAKHNIVPHIAVREECIVLEHQTEMAVMNWNL